LEKLIYEQKKIENQYLIYLRFPMKNHHWRRVIEKVLAQQKQIFNTGIHSVPDMIVSIANSYVRPIVWGKAVEKVEFGVKVNMIQMDGINLIEHISFDAFNEGSTLINSVWYSRLLFGKITMNIKRKGRARIHEDHRQIIAAELRKERAT
jgi:hypothetical protein